MIKYLPLLLLVACGSDSDPQPDYVESYVCAHTSTSSTPGSAWIAPKTTHAYQCVEQKTAEVCEAKIIFHTRTQAKISEDHSCNGEIDFLSLEDL